MASNLLLLGVPWALIRRNLSGKYKVVGLGNGVGPFEYLRTDKSASFADGVYMSIGEPRRIALLGTEDDGRDFFLPNGNYTTTTYDTISYITDTGARADGQPYVRPPSSLPPSETQGMGQLEVRGRVFTNLPQRPRSYVRRERLETELAGLLMDERHPVITLVGRGGIGKTSLALETLHTLSEEERYFAIVWFSSRDIELMPDGPKLVRPHVLTTDDMAREFVSLMEPADRRDKGFNSLDHFAHALSDTSGSPMLFVFDNFETVRSPVELHQWLDNQIRLPNKVLVTTRSREFKGDYPVEVGGMTEPQFAELVGATAATLGVESLIDGPYLEELYRESDGHPYIAKVLLGELARSGKKQRVVRVMASRDGVLDALFERTFAELTPAAQRIFLTLSSWRSLIPVVGLEAAVNRPANERIDVDHALEELGRSSLLEWTESESGDTYVSVPLSASLFGKRKLPTSAWKSAIEADLQVLQLFGAVQASGATQGVRPQVERLFRNVADRIEDQPEQFDRYLPILEYVARVEPAGWLMLARMYEQTEISEDSASRAADACRRYVEIESDDSSGWRMLASLYSRQGDYMGAAHAWVQRGLIPDSDYEDVSYAANQLNAYMREGLLTLDTAEKRILLSSLIEVMDARRDEANGTDLSRLAWLYLNVHDVDEAWRVTQAGLALEPENPHLQRLAARISDGAEHAQVQGRVSTR